MNLSQFVAFLGDKKFVPRADQRAELVAYANYVLVARDTLSPEDRRWFISCLKPLSRLPNRFKAALASQLLYWFTKSSDELIYGVKSALLDGSGVEGRVANMNSLSSMFFNGVEDFEVLGSELSRARMKSYYMDTVKLIQEALQQKKVSLKSTFQANNRVVILIQQFLRPPHAPTKDALEFARFFIDRFGKEVLIVSTCELNQYPAGSVLPTYQGNVIESYATVQSIDYEDHTMGYFQPSEPRFSADTIAESVQRIEAFDPSLILVVGGRNLLAELFVRRAFVLFYPTTASVPLCHDPYFFMWRAPTEDEVATLEREGIKDRFLFHQHPGFEPPQKQAELRREMFGLPNDAFIFIVVGMRLEADVKPDFIDMLEKLVVAPKAHIVFAGNFANYAQTVGQRQALAGRTTFLGFQNDMMAVYGLCDCYLNPKRAGGGSAIVYALAAGLPCLTCPVGDGYEAARNLPVIADYDEMATVGLNLMNDTTLCDRYQRLAFSESQRLCSRLPLVEQIMRVYTKYAEEITTRG